MLIMKYQGNGEKYYTIQKVSVFISCFFSLFLTGLLKMANFFLVKRNLFVIFLFIWAIFFSVHYVWFLNKDKSKLILHYLEYKRNLFFFASLMFTSILLFAL